MLLERLQQYGLFSIYLLLTNHRILFNIVLSLHPPFQPITVLFTFYGSVVILLSLFPSSLVDASLGIRRAYCFVARVFSSWCRGLVCDVFLCSVHMRQFLESLLRCAGSFERTLSEHEISSQIS